MPHRLETRGSSCSAAPTGLAHFGGQLPTGRAGLAAVAHENRLRLARRQPRSLGGTLTNRGNAIPDLQTLIRQSANAFELAIAAHLRAERAARPVRSHKAKSIEAREGVCQ